MQDLVSEPREKGVPRSLGHLGGEGRWLDHRGVLGPNNHPVSRGDDVGIFVGIKEPSSPQAFVKPVIFASMWVPGGPTALGKKARLRAGPLGHLCWVAW